jgi:hypothetical protein
MRDGQGLNVGLDLSRLDVLRRCALVLYSGWQEVGEGRH